MIQKFRTRSSYASACYEQGNLGTDDRVSQMRCALLTLHSLLDPAVGVLAVSPGSGWKGFGGKTWW